MLFFLTSGVSSSPYINQFLSADIIVPDPANPQNLNRYSYVLGNPLNYIDPSGHTQCRTYEECEDMGTTPMGTGTPHHNPQNDDEEDEDLGHEYTVTTVVCPEAYDCSEQEMIYYLSLHAYPGQDSWHPVRHLEIYTVDPFAWFPDGSYFNSGGRILVDISNGGLTTTNISLPTHLFHEGEVVRSLSGDSDGNWSVTTRGTGTNDTPAVGTFIDIFNDQIGPVAFEILDLQMRNTIRDHHLSP